MAYAATWVSKPGHSYISGTYSAVLVGPSRPFVNPVFAQLQTVTFSLFLGVKNRPWMRLISTIELR